MLPDFSMKGGEVRPSHADQRFFKDINLKLNYGDSLELLGPRQSPCETPNWFSGVVAWQELI